MTTTISKDTKEQLAIIDSLRDFPKLQTQVIDKLGDYVSDEAVEVVRQFIEINSADAITKQVRRTKLAEKFIGNWDESIL
tara:strand:+ start:2047 stop:2286 length:240 start_codon:yes stop_codon:yes gene_type:complete